MGSNHVHMLAWVSMKERIGISSIPIGDAIESQLWGCYENVTSCLYNMKYDEFPIDRWSDFQHGA